MLKAFADEHYKEARADLATLFVSRSLRWLGKNATQAVVTPQNWLFLTSYKKLREKLLAQRTWHFVARLGAGAFATIGGHVVNVALTLLSAPMPSEASEMSGIDASTASTPADKGTRLRGDRVVGLEGGQGSGSVAVVGQAEQMKNPDARITTSPHTHIQLLQSIATATAGMLTGDGNHFCRGFWEPERIAPNWEFIQSTVVSTRPYGGRSQVVLWEQGTGQLYEYAESVKKLNTAVQRWRTGQEVWGRRGVVVSCMGGLECTLFEGDRYDNNVAVISSNDVLHLPAIWSFCSSPQFRSELRRIDQKVNITAATFAKVPFQIADWQEVATGEYPCGLPAPQSNDPTQWLFHGHPAGMLAAGPPERSPWDISDPVGADRHPSLICREPNLANALQVAVARLLGYRWPPENDPEMRLDATARAWVERTRDFDEYADPDGIICLTPIRGERSAADRLRRLLAAAFGDVWSAARERELLAAAAGDSKPSGSLEEWLHDNFFEEHCKLFHHRPFVWHLWDGRKDGFHALVSYHRLAGPDGEGRRTLEALTFSYLGDWISRQQAAQREGSEGADGRLAAAQDLQTQLERILTGEPPCDLFVRWKPLGRQPIGWDPDIDDGVRLNIRPFMSVELRKGGRAGAGILRWKPNITWKKDRGKEPESLRPGEHFPWFWSCRGDGSLTDRTDFLSGGEFDGNRWNDLHYTNAAKRIARDRANEEDER